MQWPVRKQAIQWLVKRQAMQWPNRKQPMQWPVKRHSMQWPVRKQALQWPVKRHSMQWPVRRHSMQWPVKRHSMQWPVRKQAIQWPIKEGVPAKIDLYNIKFNNCWLTENTQVVMLASQAAVKEDLFFYKSEPFRQMLPAKIGGLMLTKPVRYTLYKLSL